MSEFIRNIDTRNSTDADGNSYYVVFCARDSENSSNKPGHAFVVWGFEDSQNQRSVQQSFGFYPDDANTDKAVFSTVTGQIVNEALRLASSDLLTARLIVQVNKEPFESSQSQVNAWRTSEYNLFARNCIHFTRSVAVTLGLFPPDVGTVQLPSSYLRQLISSSSAGERHRNNGASGGHSSVSQMVCEIAISYQLRSSSAEST